MKRSRFTEEQIIGVLRDHETENEGMERTALASSSRARTATAR